MCPIWPARPTGEIFTPMRALLTLAALTVAVAVHPSSAAAQIEAGQVIDDSVHTPLMHIAVSLQRLVDGTWTVVDSTTTDTRGLFQFKPTEPGVFRVAVLGTAQPRFVGKADTLAADSVNERLFSIPMLRQVAGRVYFEFQVEKPVQMADPSRTPAYPPELRANPHVPGEVDAQFVADVDGSVDVSTVRMLRTTRPEFSEAVRKFLITAHYLPAEVNGRKVRQVVQQAFMFD